MLQATNIRKSYGALDVLRGADLNISPAEVVSIVGKSGAGKSTLLHILGTLDRPDTGQLTIGGMNVFTMSDKRLAAFRNERVGFVFQFHHLLPEFTALENVCIPAYIGKRERQETERRGRELLRYLGLANRAEHKPAQMSGGEQQRVAVARALINKPAIVFADEPSGNLDSSNSQELHELLFKLRDDFGQSFIIVTHNEQLAAMSDRRLEMIDGILA